MKINPSLRAIQVYQAQASVSAHNVANASVEGAALRAVQSEGPSLAVSRDPAALVELSEEMVNLMEAERGIEANVKVLQSQDEALGTVLDLLG